MRVRLGPLAVTLVAVGLFVAALPGRGLAQTEVATFCATADPSGDPDNDGLTNGVECAAQLTLPGGVTLLRPGGTPTSIVPRCLGAEAIGTARNGCLDPRTPDFFVCLVPTSPTLIPADPFKFVYMPVAQGGLGLAVHELNCPADPKAWDRTVAGTQHAQRGDENPSTTPGDFGVATQGTRTPTGLAGPNHPSAGCTIFTARIQKWLTDHGISLLGYYDNLARWTIAHECAGHGLAVKKELDPTIGNHYPASSKTLRIMNQYVTYKGTTVYIPTTYTGTTTSTGTTDALDYLLE